MDQEVKYIDIKDLGLWTENPRDPVDENAIDQDIADRAFTDSSSKWSLTKLAKEMGGYYDFSELPTVVYHGEKPIVYDGNRRVILGKIKFGLVEVPYGTRVQIPDFPVKIPCNVCARQIALNNVLRKHSDAGSWLPLERDMFLHKFMDREKSFFLALDEATGLISENSYLNQRFVKEEVFSEALMKKMGFSLEKGILKSLHSEQEALSILEDLSRKIKNKEITTRKNRGKVVEVLEPSSQQLIDQNKNGSPHSDKIAVEQSIDKQNKNGSPHPVREFVEEPLDGQINPRQSKRTQKKERQLFGGSLYLRIGEVSNLYRDISDLYVFYLSRKNTLSQTFPGLIRMSLRLLCEVAAKENNKSMKDYLQSNFANAKERLDQDTKTTLSSQNISEASIVQLLHIGAHSYQASNNMDQTLALSIIVGSILSVTHGRG